MPEGLKCHTEEIFVPPPAQAKFAVNADPDPSLPEHTKAALLLGLLMFLSFALVTINSYAIARKDYFWLGLTDALLTFLNWTILKKVAEAEHWQERVGYIMGGVAGGQAALWIASNLLIRH